MEWKQTYVGTDARSLVETSDGGFALAGSTSSFTKNLLSPDFWLIKTDVNGVMEWNQTYDHNKWWEHANFVVETSDGGYAIAGDTSSFGAGGTDFWLVKTNKYGNIPEFPSWAILPLLFIASFAAIICKQRLLKKSANN